MGETEENISLIEEKNKIEIVSRECSQKHREDKGKRELKGHNKLKRAFGL